jgi:flagellar basal body-associated protein FliL
MVDKDNEKTTENQTEKLKPSDKPKPDAKAKGLIACVLIGVAVVVVSSGAGAAAGLLFRPTDTPPPAAGILEAPPETVMEEKPPQDFEYYPFEDVIVNLNVRMGNRYLKVRIFLAVSQADKAEAFPQIDKKKKELKNWVMGYLRDHTLEEVTGKKNQVRIQREIADSFNRIVWPDSRPRIDHILFDEFTVQ